jgi:hypothetical protein
MHRPQIRFGSPLGSPQRGQTESLFKLAAVQKLQIPCVGTLSGS